MQLAKPSEKLAEVFRCDALAAVNDLDTKQSRLLIVARLHLDNAIRSKLERIFYQIDQALLQSPAIPDQYRQDGLRVISITLCHPARELDSFAFGLRTKNRLDHRQHLIEVKSFLDEFKSVSYAHLL